MKAHETMECMVLKDRFLCVVSCPPYTWSQDGSCCFHAFSHWFNMDAGEGREAHPIMSSICCGATLCSIFILPSDKDDWMRKPTSSHFYLYYSSSMDIWWTTQRGCLCIYKWPTGMTKRPCFRNNFTKRHFTKLVIIPLHCKMDQVSLKNSFYSQMLATRIQNKSSDSQLTFEEYVVREGNG